MRHEFYSDADLVISGNTISFIGKQYRGPADATVDGRAAMLLPGFVDIHSHPSMEPGYKGIREEHGVPEMYMSGVYERLAVFNLDHAGQKASTEAALCEMLISGVTTVADLSFPYDGWIDLLARSGLRVFVAPWYASASWYVENRYELKYRWDEERGRRAFAQALQLIEEAKRHLSGRLSGMLYV